MLKAASAFLGLIFSVLLCSGCSSTDTPKTTTTTTTTRTTAATAPTPRHWVPAPHQTGSNF